MTYNGLYGVLPRQYVAAELLERVEVFRGATAFLNGAAPGGSGVGGAVNLVPKRAGDAPLNRLTAGWEGGDQIYAAADLSRRFGPDGDWGLRLNLASRAGEGGVEGESRDMKVVGLGLDHRGDRARFSADLGWQDNRIDAPRPQVTPGTTIPDVPLASKNFAQPWTYTDERQLFGAGRGEFDLSNGITAWVAFGGRQGKEDNSLANPSSDAAGNLTAARFDNIREDTVWSGDVGVRTKVKTGSVNHNIVASASMVQLKSRNAYTYSDTTVAWDFFAPSFQVAPTTYYPGGGDMANPQVTERVTNNSFGVADSLSFFDDRLVATVGVRYQQIKTGSYSYSDGSYDSGYSSDATTPAFALVYKPSDKVSLYANYAEALVPGKTAPNLVNSVVEGWGATPVAVTVSNGGEVLEPFRAKQAEVGVKYDVGSFGGTLSLFRTALPSELFTVTSNGNPATNERPTGDYSAGGEQENRGVELTVFGEPLEGVRVIGGATWLDAEIKRALNPALDGKSAIGVPDFQANLNVEWDVRAIDGLTLEGRVVHTGAQPASADNAVELDSWTRYDAGVRYAFEAGGKPLTLRARVENLADKNQWVAVGGYPGSNYLTLGAPRTLRLSVSAEF